MKPFGRQRPTTQISTCVWKSGGIWGGKDADLVEGVEQGAGRVVSNYKVGQQMRHTPRVGVRLPEATLMATSTSAAGMRS